MHLRGVFPAAALVATLACTSADILQLDTTPRPQTLPTSIQLLGREPERPYTVIAIVSARNDWNGDVRARLIKEAARLGGHAVLLDAGSVTRIGTGRDSGTLLQYSGKVIVFTDSTRAN
jgi:hypothetical protein